MGLVPLIVKEPSENSILLVDFGACEVFILLVKAGIGVNLPLALEPYEAERMIAVLNGREPEQDAPGDMLRNMLIALEASVVSAAIVEVENDSFVARINVKKGEQDFSFRCFPSDAIFLALRSGAPMFIEEDVLIEGVSLEETKDFLATIEEQAPQMLES